MRKLYYLACSIVLSGLTACEVSPLADGSSAVTVEGVATAPVSHTIPAAKALEHLAGALVALDGPTRSPGESRTVQRVTAVTRADLRASATRSGGCSADSLVYLVEFEDGKGSAILAADDRLEPVIVIYDTYKMKKEDLREPPVDPDAWRTLENLYCEEDDDYYLGASELPELPVENTLLEHQLIYDYINKEVEDTGGAVYTVESGWNLSRSVSPMLTTQWHQGAPFKLRFPITASWTIWAPAGCVTIAVAQIMNYHQFPRNYCDWSLVNQYNPNDPLEDNGQDVLDEVALLSKKVAGGCRVECNFFGSGETFSTPAKAKRFLRDVGYTGTEKHLGYDADVIKKTLDNDCPVFIGALASSNHGHAWVIDGYLNYENIIKTYNGPTTLLKTNTVNKLFVHCNWGWQDTDKNGYYASKVFDTRKGPADLNGYPAATRGANTKNYTWWFRIVTYNKPR